MRFSASSFRAAAGRIQDRCALDDPSAGQDDEAPFMSLLRLTISMRRPGLAAMALFTCQALYPLSAQTSSSQLNRWRILSKTRAAPSRS